MNYNFFFSVPATIVKREVHALQEIYPISALEGRILLPPISLSKLVTQTYGCYPASIEPSTWRATIKVMCEFNFSTDML